MAKNWYNRTTTFKRPDTEYVEASSYCELFTENIGQPVRNISEIPKEFLRAFEHCKLGEYEMFSPSELSSS